jgi:hypothetical protein
VGKVSTFAAGVTLGAGAVYFFDPDLGRRRRALFRDKLQHLARKAQEDVDAGARDLSNRARGAIAKLQSYMHDGSDSDGLHDEPGDVPGLQGSATLRRDGFLEGQWPPAWQLLAGLAGAFILATGWPGIAGRFVSRLLGAVLLGRALVNPSLGHGGSHPGQNRGCSKVELGSTSST